MQEEVPVMVLEPHQWCKGKTRQVLWTYHVCPRGVEFPGVLLLVLVSLLVLTGPSCSLLMYICTFCFNAADWRTHVAPSGSSDNFSALFNLSLEQTTRKEGEVLRAAEPMRERGMNYTLLQKKKGEGQRNTWSLCVWLWTTASLLCASCSSCRPHDLAASLAAN